MPSFETRELNQGTASINIDGALEFFRSFIIEAAEGDGLTAAAQILATVGPKLGGASPEVGDPGTTSGKRVLLLGGQANFVG